MKLALLFLALLGWPGDPPCASAAPNSAWQPLKEGEAVSVQVVGSLHGATPSPLYMNATPNGRAVVARIVRWYNAAPPTGVQPMYGRHGYPMKLRIGLSDGRFITVEQAYDCTTQKLANGWMKSCRSADGEIVIHLDSQELRGKNRALYDWLAGGWRKER